MVYRVYRRASSVTYNLATGVHSVCTDAVKAWDGPQINHSLPRGPGERMNEVFPGRIIEIALPHNLARIVDIRCSALLGTGEDTKLRHPIRGCP